MDFYIAEKQWMQLNESLNYNSTTFMKFGSSLEKQKDWCFIMAQKYFLFDELIYVISWLLALTAHDVRQQ